MLVTLPSNASTAAYPGNTASSFTVKLPDRLQFGEGWGVGLSEIHFPHLQQQQVSPTADFQNLLYVYADIVEPSSVGDVKAPLLRVIGSDSIAKAFANFDMPHYYPLSNREFNRIEIVIKDLAGNMPSFASGTSIVTLHFKKLAPQQQQSSWPPESSSSSSLS